MFGRRYIYVYLVYYIINNKRCSTEIHLERRIETCGVVDVGNRIKTLQKTEDNVFIEDYKYLFKLRR